MLCTHGVMHWRVDTCDFKWLRAKHTSSISRFVSFIQRNCEKMIINYRFLMLLWMLWMWIFRRQFRLVLRRCTRNLQVFVMVRLRSFRYRAHDDDDFDVLHLMPVPSFKNQQYRQMATVQPKWVWTNRRKQNRKRERNVHNHKTNDRYKLFQGCFKWPKNMLARTLQKAYTQQHIFV